MDQMLLEYDRNRTARRAAVWVLRLAVCSQCLAAAYQALMVGTPVSTLTGLLEFDQWFGYLLIGAALAAVTTSEGYLVTIAGIWMAMVAGAHYMTGATFFERIAPVAHAARWGCPIALVLLFYRRDVAALWLLRFAAALTFAAHGLEAILLNPKFIGFITAAGHVFFDITIGRAVCEQLLYAIGGIDLVLAALILTTRWRIVAGYMAAWGMITAWARVVYGGWEAWDGTAIRMTNCAVAAAVLVYWWVTIAKRKSASPSAQATDRQPALR